MTRGVRSQFFWQVATLLLGVSFTLTASYSAAAEATGAPAIQQFSIGFAGRYKVGHWTPVEVTLAGGGTDRRIDLQIVAPDGDGLPSEVTVRDVQLNRDQTTQVRAYVKFGRPRAAVRVSVIEADHGTMLAERTFSGGEVPTALSATQGLIVVVGTPLDLSAATKLVAPDSASAAEVAYLDQAERLPDRWFGYDGVDQVVLTTGKPEMYRALGKPAAAALQRWIELGGRLVVSVGSAGEQLLKPEQPLDRFAPGRFVGTHELRRFGAIENFAGAEERFDANWSEPGRPMIEAAQLADVTGHVEATEDEVPLVVRRAVGFGQSTFVALDIDSPAFRRWPARPQFLALLLERNASISGDAGRAAAAAQSSQLGYDDISGQLRTALDQYPDVRITPFWLIATLATVYVLLLFPLDYWLGRRGSGWARPWIRYAGLAVVASVGIWLLGRRNRAERVQANQASVIDFDLDTHLARGASWFGVYSPRSALYSLAVEPNWPGPHAAAAPAITSWFGLPGTSLGGMNSRTAELPLFDRPYPCDAEATALGPTPLAAWSSRSYTARWFNTDARLIDADLHENADHQLAGTIKLTTGQGSSAANGGAATGQGGGATFELHGGVLFYDRWAYKIPESLTAGAQLEIERLESPLMAETLLYRAAGKSTAKYKPLPLTTRASIDRGRILEIMQLFRAAGGRQYTGLTNRYQSFVDLSDLLALDRAVLIAVGPPAATLTVDGQSLPSSDTAPPVSYYRFVIPVAKQSPPRGAGR